ncbi:hypothetical protein SAMN05421823_104335 [Catalinimonas alkaloidigena]|uniref:Uncharacterized protein n=1 Tax=Catalinimonas alkaloidigena TaxID=1075417 RepID=A0A1G9H6S4_9BACT|nr:hypothetical protein SAMN05421823_104335 [Catalinimonas alkaloidigena]
MGKKTGFATPTANGPCKARRRPETTTRTFDDFKKEFSALCVQPHQRKPSRLISEQRRGSHDTRHTAPGVTGKVTSRRKMPPPHERSCICASRADGCPAVRVGAPQHQTLLTRVLFSVDLPSCKSLEKGGNNASTHAGLTGHFLTPDAVGTPSPALHQVLDPLDPHALAQQITESIEF